MEAVARDSVGGQAAEGGWPFKLSQVTPTWPAQPSLHLPREGLYFPWAV